MVAQECQNSVIYNRYAKLKLMRNEEMRISYQRFCNIQGKIYELYRKTCNPKKISFSWKLTS